MATTRDPFESYLLKADNLFQAGDIVQAGQIWQAILKKSPNHSDARAGLYKVKLYFDARATQDGLIPGQEALLAPTPAPPAQPAPAPVVSHADDIERLLRDGCTLFDMGQSEDALKKWEQILELEPGHQLATAYIQDARKDLGFLASPEPAALAPAEMDPVPEPVAKAPISQRDLPERIENLLRDGTQLYDMGMAEEASQKWEQVLELAPGHADAQTYLAMAKREREAAPAPVPAAPVAAIRPKEDPDVRLRKAESLLHQGRLEESAFLFQEILNLAPENFRARQGLRQANGLIEARQHTHAAPLPAMYPPTPPVPWAEAEGLAEAPAPMALVAAEDAPEAVEPPATLTAPPPVARKGLEIPKLLRQLEAEIPAWLKTPVAIGSLVGGIILLNLAFLWFRSHRKDVLLTNAVVDFRTTTQGQLARSMEIADLTDNATTLRREAESLLESQPLFAYYRGQELIRLNPLDGPAAKLMGRAGQLMAQSPGFGKGSLKEVEKLLATGDLDGARKMLLNLLQAEPENPDLKARAGRVFLTLTEIYALKERWGDAEDQLKEGQMMFPADKSWAARLQLLGRIKNLRPEERKPWIPLLG